MKNLEILRSSQKIEEKYKKYKTVTYILYTVIKQYRDSIDDDCVLGRKVKPAPLGLWNGGQDMAWSICETLA